MQKILSFKTNISRTLLAVLVFSSFAGCKTTYIPATQNIVLPEDKNELLISFNAGFADNSENFLDPILSSAFSTHVTWAFNKKLAVYTGIFASSPIVFGDLGISFFSSYSKDRKLRFTGNLGYGFGNRDDGNPSFKYHKFYVQPGVSFTTNNFYFIISTNLGSVNYFKIRNTGEEPNEVFDLLLQNENNLFFEPAFTLQYKYKFFKFQSQFVHSTNLDTSMLDSSRWLFTIGGTLTLKL